jgi:hypothetical protein
VSALDGGPPRPKEQVVTSNGLLHDHLLALLNQESFGDGLTSGDSV